MVVAMAVLLSHTAMATCTRITTSTQITPADGVAKNWDSAAVEGYSGNQGIPSTVYLSTNTSFQPDGTLIASGVAPFVQSATSFNGGYSSEQVLFRCDAADEANLLELYATNGDYTYGGMYEDGAVGGIQGGYATYVKGVVLRYTNQITGEYYSRYWKSRKLTDLDRDSQGRILVKAKNFSGVITELFRLESSRGATTAASYTYGTMANAYIAFSGPGLTAPAVGSDSATNYQGWYLNWPAVWSLYRTQFQRVAFCGLTDFTPYVSLPPISVAELNDGNVSSANFNVNVECQTTATSGTTAGRVAIGFLQPPANVAAATDLNLKNANGGVSHLLSDNYGAPGVAKGVGIKLYRNNQPINFLSSETTQTGNAGGWYGVLDGAQSLVNTDAGKGINYYNETFRAQLEKIEGQKVGGGSVNAHAQVIVRVQ